MSSASATELFGDLAAYAADTQDNGISPFFRERRKFYSDANWNTLVSQLANTCTLYVGNLSFFTTEEQLLELFGRIGPVERIIMGLNKATKTPCGFFFVIYERHEDAQACQRFLSGTSVDERIIRADLDPGFEEGRQFGRSRHSGGQRRDDYRKEFDAGRGGWAPPPQKDIFPLLAEHPVGTTTVSTHTGRHAHGRGYRNSAPAPQQHFLQAQQQMHEQQQAAEQQQQAATAAAAVEGDLSMTDAAASRERSRSRGQVCQ